MRVDEQLGAQLPLDATFTDAAGQPVQLGSVFGQGKPVVLALVYYDCPMLCGLIMSGMARAMRESGLEPGQDFTALTISFDPEEQPPLARERQRGYLQSIGLAEHVRGLALLGRPGRRRPAGRRRRRLPLRQGRRHRRVGPHGRRSSSSPPTGKVSRYLYGIEFPPKDFRLSLVEAAGGRVGTSFDKLILTCFRYDPASRKYQPFAFGIAPPGRRRRRGGAGRADRRAGLARAQEGEADGMNELLRKLLFLPPQLSQHARDVDGLHYFVDHHHHGGGVPRSSPPPCSS